MLARTILISALIAAPALAAERVFPVGAFDRLAAGTSADVTVTTGKAIGVRAVGSDAALDKLDIRVEDGALKIGTKKGLSWNWGNEDITIAVTVPMLREVNVAGSGDVVVDRIKVAAFKSSVAGSGNLRLPSLTADTSAFSVAGAGDVTAAGTSPTVKASVAGSGDLDIAALKAQTLGASVAGSGNVSAFATGTAAVSVAGSGDVIVRGGAKCSVSKRGSGAVDCGDATIR